MITKIKEFIKQFKYGLLIFACIILMSLFSFFYSLYNKNQFEKTQEEVKQVEEQKSKPVEFLTEKQKFEIKNQQTSYYNNLPYKNFSLKCELFNNVKPEITNSAVVFSYIPAQTESEILSNFGCTKDLKNSDKNFTKLICSDADKFMVSYLNFLSKSFGNKLPNTNVIFKANNIYDRLLVEAGGDEYAEPFQKTDAEFNNKVYEITFGNYKLSYLNSIFTISAISNIKTKEARITIPPFLPSSATVNGLKDLPGQTCKLVPLFPFDQRFHKVILEDGAELKLDEIQVLENYGVSLVYVLDAKNNSFYPIFTKTGYLTGKDFKYLNNKNFVLGIFD